MMTITIHAPTIETRTGPALKTPSPDLSGAEGPDSSEAVDCAMIAVPVRPNSSGRNMNAVGRSDVPTASYAAGNGSGRGSPARLTAH